jgi:GNAT superfamily N-acetyltransferase
MPNFDIVRKSQPKKTFRVASVMGKFDLQSEQIEERFIGNIDIDSHWQVGLIIGNSGTGKTTIAKQLFPNSYITHFEYSADCVMDDMPENKSVEDITKAFNSVGFSSPPSWLKPYDVLSNGEKMRCDLARAILSDSDLFVFDEFTSVVDRNVAQIGSFALQKAIRKTQKKFIAVTCHYDVQDWLLPDWVFDTNTMTFQRLEGQKKNRPDIKFEIFNFPDKSIWKMFAKYHYLSHTHNNAANVYVALLNNHIAAFYSVLAFPHPKIKNAYKGHRLVVLPDYQGIGIGLLLRTEIAKIYVNKMKKVFIATTSHPAIIQGLKKHPNWIITRIGRTGKSISKSKNINHKNFCSNGRITVSWQYIADKTTK